MGKERFWGWLLAAWSFIAVFFLGVLDLEPQVREIGSQEPSFFGQIIGLSLFLLLLIKYLEVKEGSGGD